MLVIDQTYSPSRLPSSRNASCSSTYLGPTPTSILHLGWLFPTSKVCIQLWVFDFISHSLLWLRHPSWFLHLPSVTFFLSTVNRLFGFFLVIFYSECPYPWSERAFTSLHLSAPDSHPMGILLTGGSHPLETVSQNHKCPNLQCVPKPSNPSRSQTWEKNQPESNVEGWLFKANVFTGTKSQWKELLVVSGLYSVPADLSGLPRWLIGWRICLQCRRRRKCGFDPWVEKIPWRRAWQPTSVFFPGEFHAQRRVEGLQSTGSPRVRHEWSDSACMHS